MKMKTTKTKKSEFEIARGELHYWQMRVRMDIHSLKATIQRCKEVGAKLRKIQKGE